jgi:hypothetical protein
MQWSIAASNRKSPINPIEVAEVSHVSLFSPKVVLPKALSALWKPSVSALRIARVEVSVFLQALRLEREDDASK